MDPFDEILSVLRERLGKRDEEGDRGMEGDQDVKQIKNRIEKEYLTPSPNYDDGLLARAQIYWDRPIDIGSCLYAPLSSAKTQIRLERKGLSGQITGYTEVTLKNPTLDSTTSTSLDWSSASKTHFVRGQSNFLPFTPGGFHDGQAEVDGDGLGLDVDGGVVLSEIESLDIDDLDLDHLHSLVGTVKPIKRYTLSAQPQTSATDPAESHGPIDEHLPSDPRRILTGGPPPMPPKKVRAPARREWAHLVDVNQELVNFDELVPQMAFRYPFKLDNFQKEAIYRLECGDSVFVAAHTSAGKTVVAEYAIALSKAHMTRCIYTSPIKALSNQKFRDFRTTFGDDVGILTGDVQINPEASCLIMTTEILRSMLYKGADLIRDVEFVVFDEVHYVNDSERGVVWEEVILMLPDHVSMIMLSATVPNALEFAQWVGRTKRREIYVISTLKRPVPLEHYLYTPQSKDLFKIVDASKSFLSSGWKAANDAAKGKEKEILKGPDQRGRGRGVKGAPQGHTTLRGRGDFGTMAKQNLNLWIHLVGLLRKKELLPVVIFTFSKKRCEENASSMPNTDLCSSSEKSEVHVMIERSLQRLKGSDRRLPQFARMKDLLSRGIAVHHGGLLPIVKEIVELLFARGLVKVLFATETFAMGVNMPARTVVFAGTRKHDGQSFRDLLPGEYTQMSGRAGRRGLDPTGVVIIVCPNEDVPDSASLNKMILGTPNKLKSQFRLTYNMVLNLLRVEFIRVEEMIKRSFSENAAQTLLPEQQARIVSLEKEMKKLPDVDPETDDGPYQLYDLTVEILHTNKTLYEDAINQPSTGRALLASGRLVLLNDETYQNEPGVILRSAPSTLSGSRPYWVLVFGKADRSQRNGTVQPIWSPKVDARDDWKYELDAVSTLSISFCSTTVIPVNVEGIVDRQEKASMFDVLGRFKQVVDDCGGNSLIEYDLDRIKKYEYQGRLEYRNNLIRRLEAIPADYQNENYGRVHARRQMENQLQDLRIAASDQNLELLPDYEQRIDVLKDMGFIDDNRVVLLKGRVACEINSAHELVLTELILDNTLSQYSAEEVVALLSCFVFQEKSDSIPVLTPRLDQGLDQIRRVADRVSQVQTRHKMGLGGEEFSTELNLGLVEVVYHWARGMAFDQITTLTDVLEGTIVRCITRLDETCREIRDAARIIGDASLYQKMEDAQAKIRRDVVFVASLYV